MLGALTEKIRAIRARTANRKRFIAELMKAVEDGHLTLEEVSHLDALESSLGLKPEDYAPARVQAYLRAVAVAKADGSITQDELADLRRLQSFLGLGDAQIESTQLELARLRLVTEIQEGHLPMLGPVNGLILQRAECAHWQEPANLLEERVLRRTYQGGSSGVSIRIMRGLSYRVGAQRGFSVAETGIVPVSPGNFLVTSKRVLFNGDFRSFAIKFDKLIGIEPFSDGLRLNAETGKPRLVQFTSSRNTDIICAILSHVINASRAKG